MGLKNYTIVVQNKYDISRVQHDVEQHSNISILPKHRLQ